MVFLQHNGKQDQRAGLRPANGQTVHAQSDSLGFVSWPRDAACASPQSPQMQDTQSTFNRNAVTLGEKDMTCVKTLLLKCYKNPNTGAIKNKFANVPTSWKFRGFWSLSLSRKSQVQGTSMCSIFHLQHTKVESCAPNTQRNMCPTTYETFVYNIMKIRSGYLELLRVNRHGNGNRRIL
jgi:hypothetical protein